MKQMERVIIAILAAMIHSTMAFVPMTTTTTTTTTKATFTTTTNLNAMKRPILDQIASFVFQLEMDRVEKSSTVDDKGRYGEPMEWSESNSLANQFSTIIAENSLGYQFKQFVADIIAGNDYDKDQIQDDITTFVQSNSVAMFSFTTCPFCRRAKDYFEENNIDYQVLELDTLEGNRGNQIRAMLGRRTQRTSVPCIFIDGDCIGGCNDGPGLLPLAESGELKVLLNQAKANAAKRRFNNPFSFRGWN